MEDGGWRSDGDGWRNDGETTPSRERACERARAVEVEKEHERTWGARVSIRLRRRPTLFRARAPPSRARESVAVHLARAAIAAKVEIAHRRVAPLRIRHRGRVRGARGGVELAKKNADRSNREERAAQRETRDERHARVESVRVFAGPSETTPRPARRPLHCPDDAQTEKRRERGRPSGATESRPQEAAAARAARRRAARRTT